MVSCGSPTPDTRERPIATLVRVSDRAPQGGGGGSRLSPQTLIVASLASLTAAIVTSHFWRGGTPITAALTPVLVALASEIYRRPAERITRLSSRAASSTRVRGSVAARDRVTAGPPAAHLDDWAPNGGRPTSRGWTCRSSAPGPVRVYRQQPDRRLHIRIVLATALVAFAIAIAALTLPELIFGGSLASHARTTFFGGTHHHSSTHTVTTTTSARSSTATATTATKTVTAPAQTQQTSTQTSTTPGARRAGPARRGPGHNHHAARHPRPVAPQPPRRRAPRRERR